jgi:hypothetical protein
MRRKNIDRLLELTKELLSSQTSIEEKTEVKVENKEESIEVLDLNGDGKVDEADVEMVQKEIRRKKIVNSEE